MYSVANVYSLSTPAEIISNTNFVFFLQNGWSPRQNADQIIWYEYGKTRGGKAQEIGQEKALGFQLISSQISIKVLNL